MQNLQMNCSSIGFLQLALQNMNMCSTIGNMKTFMKATAKQKWPWCRSWVIQKLPPETVDTSFMFPLWHQIFSCIRSWACDWHKQPLLYWEKASIVSQVNRYVQANYFRNHVIWTFILKPLITCMLTVCGISFSHSYVYLCHSCKYANVK